MNGTFNLAKNLPEELAGLPKNVSFLAKSCLHMLSCTNMPDPPPVSTNTCHSVRRSTVARCSAVLSVWPEADGRCCLQVSDAAASQQQSIAQAGNSTYLMESFTKLVHDLEEPLGVSFPLL